MLALNRLQLDYLAQANHWPLCTWQAVYCIYFSISREARSVPNVFFFVVVVVVQNSSHLHLTSF